MSAPIASTLAASMHCGLCFQKKADRLAESFSESAASNVAVQGHIYMPLSTSYLLLAITPRFLHLTAEP